MSAVHQPVLLREAVDALVTRRDGTYVDGTFGRGGHSRAILEELGEAGRLLAVDKDPDAIAVAARLKEGDDRFDFEHDSFARLPHQLRRKGIGTALLLAAMEWTGAQTKSQRVILGMQPKNFPAINMVQRLGFDYCGYIDHYYPNRDIAIFFTKWII